MMVQGSQSLVHGTVGDNWNPLPFVIWVVGTLAVASARRTGTLLGEFV